mmetsp:Transcript_86944/g.158809  ORF Transcript_86944/g.158809 Transcript_86944/m.158809 type:complete len:131 (+) Transcript_86944:1386-1778(+)
MKARRTRPWPMPWMYWKGVCEIYIRKSPGILHKVKAAMLLRHDFHGQRPDALPVHSMSLSLTSEQGLSETQKNFCIIWGSCLAIIIIIITIVAGLMHGCQTPSLACSKLWCMSPIRKIFNDGKKCLEAPW